MLSKEEIDNYKYFENKYLQQPITLLTKKNLELLEKHCEKQVRHEVGQRLKEHEIVLELLHKYEQQESDKQKLIEKLEGDIEKARKEYTITLSDRQDGIRQEAQEILKIVKGENNEN